MTWFFFNRHVVVAARHCVHDMLQPDPKDRPTAAAEVLYKLNGGDLKLAGGIATKLESGQSVRAVVCSAGHISASLKTTVADGLDLTACAQVHKDMKYKYGLQFAMKT